jgi:hypothetical protein
MTQKRNQYESEAKKKSLLGEITKDLETKGDIKNTAIETVKDIVVGVLGGGIVGSAIGKASLVIGAVVTGIGHYTKSRLTSIFGIGLMAANGFQKSDTTPPVNGTDEKEKDMLDGVKDRVMTFKENFQQKLFLDKLLTSKKTEDTTNQENTNGVGEVQYFVYPENKELEGATEKELDMSALEHIENRIASSANNFSQKEEMKGILPMDDMGELDPTENIY